VRGIARFYVASVEPEVEVYMTPIHIDPEHPAMPISHPGVYAVYLAKKLGKFATLGLAEDTWALNERVIDEKAFFEQTLLIADERVKMFEEALEKTPKGLVCTVFDTTDRVQHMFYRYLDPTHPANAGKDSQQWRDAIERVYRRMDELLGRVWDDVVEDPATCFVVMSDHGFTNFRRGVNLNAWLRQEGYLFLREGKETSGDWFEAVDWSRTKAFSLGLTGMFINRKGASAAASSPRAPSTTRSRPSSSRASRRSSTRRPASAASSTSSRRPTTSTAPTATTRPTSSSATTAATGTAGTARRARCRAGLLGQHEELERRPLRRPAHRAGVLFSNLPIATETPAIVDIAPSVMALFGLRRRSTCRAGRSSRRSARPRPACAARSIPRR
jgi:hypothetical protein